MPAITQTDAERAAENEAWRATPGPSATELHELADRLRELAKAVFQRQDKRFLKDRAASILRAQDIQGWYTRAVAREDKEQTRLFHTILVWLGRICFKPADSPTREQWESLANDVDSLAAPKSLLVETGWSIARSPSDWLKVFAKLNVNCRSLKTFERRRKDGPYRSHPGSTSKSVRLALGDLPASYSDNMTV